ncbi:hypothetical protein [Chitinophaga vietnamensis]|uniref:hypothetical protein n=1 Tax=Chitinophaga vietnamensis TaxID=2593957 RepID=UPI00117843CC|nr:hypothetical protein [Chitinophaga vietnamensis]
MKRFRSWFFLLLILGGCTATHITSEWQSPDIHPYRYRRILVLALLPAAEQSWRQELETHLANDLATMGYTTVTSSSIPYNNAFQGKDEKTAIAMLQQAEVDAVLTITLRSTSTAHFYIPWIFDYSLLDPDYNFLPDYLNSALALDAIPSYDLDHTTYYWESNLYDMLNGKLVYSVQTASLDINSARQFSHRYGKAIVQRMKKAKVLERQYPSDVE